MADWSTIIAAAGGATATLITAVSTFLSARANDKMKSQELRLEQMRMDQERMARDLGRTTRDLQDTLGTIDDRTQSTQRLTEGIALAQGNTPIPTPVKPLGGPPPPKVEPIPTGSQGGYRRG